MTAIRDLMVSHLIQVEPGATAADAASQMAENRVGAVLVIFDGKLEGIVSERDLVTRVLASGQSASRISAGDISTTNVVTVEVDAPLRSVLQTFRESRFRHLPVMEDGRAVGILSTRDFLAFLVDGFEQLIDDARYHDQIAAGLDPYDHLGGAYGQ